jgi:hypothetical protein
MRAVIPPGRYPWTKDELLSNSQKASVSEPKYMAGFYEIVENI